jgi:hypothetical protein
MQPPTRRWSRPFTAGSRPKQPIPACTPRFDRSGLFVACSSRKELHGDRREFVVKLENSTMPRVGIDDEFGVLDATVQILGKYRGHHPVVVAVGDEGRLGELRQVRRSGAAVLLNRLELCPERLQLDGASRSTVRSLSRLTNAHPASLPAALRLKNRNSFGSAKVNAARNMS